MKKSLLLYVFISLIISTLQTSCVSNKKYMVLEAKVDKLKKEKSIVLNQLNECTDLAKNLSEEKALTLNDLSILSADSKMTIADHTKRLKRLQDIIQTQNVVMNNLKNAITEAFTDNNDAFNVNLKDGIVYISIEEKLLFKPGSFVVNPNGKELLRKLSGVIKSTKNINIIIDSHTDNFPIKTGIFKDYWGLSIVRAASIIHILTNEFGLNAEYVTALSKVKFHASEASETAESSTNNGRTEIIISSDLKELQKLLYQ